MWPDILTKIYIGPWAAWNYTFYTENLEICYFLTVPDNIADNFTR